MGKNGANPIFAHANLAVLLMKKSNVQIFLFYPFSPCPLPILAVLVIGVRGDSQNGHGAAPVVLSILG